jgi:SAM-dependent methyltransferase
LQHKVKFVLYEEEVFAPVTRYDDPLRYYYKPLVGALYRKRISDGLSLLKPPYERVLDFGYGSGLLFPSLNKIADELYGIDILSDTEKLAPILGKLDIKADLRKNDILKEDYPDNYFDLITAFSVFEHITEFEPILAEMYRILKPGGELLIGMPRVSAIMPLLFRLIGFKNIEDFHVTNHRQVRATALQSFQLVRTKTLPVPMPECCGLYFNCLLKKPTR